jgi:hypothetical protein
MKILDRLDQLEKDATPGPWECGGSTYREPEYYAAEFSSPVEKIGVLESYDYEGYSSGIYIRERDSKLIQELRNRARELIEVARAAEIACRISSTSNMLALKEALERLEK